MLDVRLDVPYEGSRGVEGAAPDRLAGQDPEPRLDEVHPRRALGCEVEVNKRMLGQPRLPEQVRIKVLEYVDEKRAGQYGHKPPQVRVSRKGIEIEWD